MGSIVSRFRKKRSRVDQLDEVHQNVKKLTEARKQTKSYERSFIAYLVIVSFLLYLVGAGILYMYFRPTTKIEIAVKLIPFVVFPIIVILIKWLLSSYFDRCRNKYDLQIKELTEKKKTLLAEIKEVEPYNVVRQILEKYEPASLPRAPPPNRGPGELRQRRPPQAQPPPPRTGSAGRGRPPPPNQPHPPPPNQPHPPPPNQPHPPPPNQPHPPSRNQPQPPHRPSPSASSSNPSPPGPPLPYYLPPRNRSITEKMVDYLIGDGPNRRYALICSSCHSHNGMALQDEFEYTTFKCAYCFTLNPARKTLPTAPRIERQNSKREDPEEEEPGQPVTSASANNRREEHKEGVEDPKELGASASANSRREELKEGVEEPKEFGTSASANSRREEFEEDEKKSEEDLGSSSLAHKTSISHPGRPSEVDELTVPTNEEQPVIQD